MIGLTVTDGRSDSGQRLGIREEDATLPGDASLADPDTQLMMEVKAGSAIAFEELMARNQAKVHSLLFHFVGDREQAEDLTQEVFLKVYRARESWEPSAKFSTWLFRIVHNLALNALRSRRRRPELLFGGAKTSTGENQSGTFSVEENIVAKSGLLPTRQLDRQETQKVVRLAMESLGERQREAILLHRFEGMSYQQIADVMELTPQAVKSLLCRARIGLREALAPYLEEGRLPE